MPEVSETLDVTPACTAPTGYWRLPFRLLHHPVARNAMALYLQTFAAYVLPLLTVPYLARVLRPDTWGMIVFAQAFASWLSRFLEYGFNYSATRELARNRGDINSASDTVAGVLGAQMLLVAISAIVSLVLAMSLPIFRIDPWIATLAWVAAVAQGCNPIWFYQGSQRLHVPATLSIVNRVICTAGVFLFVTRPEYAWRVLALQASTGFVATAAAIGLMYGTVAPRWPSLRGGLQALRSGWRLFVMRGSITLYSSANTFIIGLFAPASQIAFYGGTEKIIRALLDMQGPVSQSLYPHMNRLLVTDRERAARVARVTIVVLAVFAFALASLITLFAPMIVSIILGPDYNGAISILRVLAWPLPFVAVSNVLGVQWMLPLGLERAVNAIVLSAGVVHIFVATFLASTFGGVGLACAVISTEATVAIAMYVCLRRKKLFFSRRNGFIE